MNPDTGVLSLAGYESDLVDQSWQHASTHDQQAYINARVWLMGLVGAQRPTIPQVQTYGDPPYWDPNDVVWHAMADITDLDESWSPPQRLETLWYPGAANMLEHAAILADPDTGLGLRPGVTMIVSTPGQ